MTGVDQLLAERRRSFYKIQFSGEIEAQYRHDLRRQLRIPRLVYFLVVALGFAVAPLQENSLFMPPAELVGFSTLFAWLVSPICLAAAYMSWAIHTPRWLAQGVQSAAVITIFASVLALRHLGLTTDLQYPASMLGILITSVAIFGSFSAYRLMPTMLVFYGLGMAQEVVYASADSVGELPLYVLMYHAMISFLGAYTNEILRRQSWIQGKSASLLARTDVLTGLANRASFNRRYATAFAQARRERKTIALMALDLDHFKKINDQLGHAAGDAALKLVGERLRSVSGLRPLDLCARVGGEEFMVFWYDVDPANLSALVETVMESIRTAELRLTPLGGAHRLSASAGVTWLVPQADTDPEAIQHRVDALMYRAKNGGRDQAVMEGY